MLLPDGVPWPRLTLHCNGHSEKEREREISAKAFLVDFWIKWVNSHRFELCHRNSWRWQFSSKFQIIAVDSESSSCNCQNLPRMGKKTFVSWKEPMAAVSRRQSKWMFGFELQ
jgi:hypothetical protein